MNHQETNGLLRFIGSLWPTVPFRPDDSTEMVVAWQVVLADITVEEAQAVVVKHARRGEAFPPTAGVVALVALDERDRASGRGTLDVDVAFGIVMDAVRRRGHVHGPPAEWPDPAIGEVVNAISWRELCESTNAEAMRAHFFRLYDVASKRALNARRRQQDQGLPGLMGPAIGQLLPRNTDDV